MEWVQKKLLSLIGLTKYVPIAVTCQPHICTLHISGSFYRLGWDICSKAKNPYDHCYSLFNTAEHGLRFNRGLGSIYNDNPTGINGVESVTCLNTFVVAVKGHTSRLETIYNLLLQHPVELISHGLIPNKRRNLCTNLL